MYQHCISIFTRSPIRGLGLQFSKIQIFPMQGRDVEKSQVFGKSAGESVEKQPRVHHSRFSRPRCFVASPGLEPGSKV